MDNRDRFPDMPKRSARDQSEKSYRTSQSILLWDGSIRFDLVWCGRIGLNQFDPGFDPGEFTAPGSDHLNQTKPVKTMLNQNENRRSGF